MKQFLRNAAAPSARQLALAMAVATLGACGGTGQDNGNASQASAQTYSGLAIDGHLARAKVYIDSDNNGTRDAWEPYAFTDNDGYYSFNPITQKNYCAANATAEENQYCLRANRSYDNAMLRIDGGYDALTGEPFAGQMSRRLNSVTPGVSVQGIISPLTSLTAGLSDADAAKVLQTLGVEAADLNKDYTDKHSGLIDNKLLNLALKVHKVVALLGDKIVDNYSALGDQSGTPNDATVKVYEKLAKEISQSNQSLDTLLADKNLLKRVAAQVETEVKAIYDEKKINLPGNSGDNTKFDRAVDTAANIAAVTNQLIPPDKTYSLPEAQGGARALEALVIKGLKEVGSGDTSIDNAVHFYRQGNATARENLVNSLASDTADVSQLAQNSFVESNFTTPEGTQIATQLPDDAMAFTQIGGKQIRVSDLDLGQGSNNLRDIEFELYFAGAANATTGAFNACAKYIKNANASGTLGKGNSRGELITGYWSLLGADSDKGSYSLLMTFEFLGANYQAIMKSAGSTRIEDVTYQKLRFDNNDEYRIWHSANGLVNLTSLPTSSTECQSRLPSRIGI